MYGRNEQQKTTNIKTKIKMNEKYSRQVVLFYRPSYLILTVYKGWVILQTEVLQYPQRYFLSNYKLHSISKVKTTIHPKQFIDLITHHCKAKAISFWSAKYQLIIMTDMKVYMSSLIVKTYHWLKFQVCIICCSCAIKLKR